MPVTVFMPTTAAVALRPRRRVLLRRGVLRRRCMRLRRRMVLRCCMRLGRSMILRCCVRFGCRMILRRGMRLRHTAVLRLSVVLRVGMRVEAGIAAHVSRSRKRPGCSHRRRMPVIRVEVRAVVSASRVDVLRLE